MNEKCIGCGNDLYIEKYKGLQSIYTNDNFTLTFCTKCYHGKTLPVPTEKYLNNIYSTNYNYSAHHLINSEKKMRAKGLARIIDKIEDFKPRKLLDIGCMQGALLEVVKPNFDAIGIEIDSESVKIAQNKGLAVYNITIEAIKEKLGGDFDYVVLSHVFEHLTDLSKETNELKNLMSEDGYLIIAVPNSKSFLRTIFGRFWGWWQVPVHVNHFNEKSLSGFLESQGFKLEFTKMRGGDSLMILLCLMNLLNQNNTEQKMNFLKKLIIEIWSFFARYWYYIGDDELIQVYRKNEE